MHVPNRCERNTTFAKSQPFPLITSPNDFPYRVPLMFPVGGIVCVVLYKVRAFCRYEKVYCSAAVRLAAISI